MQFPDVFEKLVSLCALLPYGVIALLVRIVMARVFFLAGQDKIRGPRIPLHVSLPGSDLTLLDMSVILPAEIKDSTLQLRNPIRLFPGAGRRRGLSRHLRRVCHADMLCEGRISVTKRRHGLNRCRYRGDIGMRRWVGLGVIADNIINIGRTMKRKSSP